MHTLQRLVLSYCAKYRWAHAYTYQTLSLSLQTEYLMNKEGTNTYILQSAFSSKISGKQRSICEKIKHRKMSTVKCARWSRKPGNRRGCEFRFTPFAALHLPPLVPTIFHVLPFFGVRFPTSASGPTSSRPRFFSRFSPLRCFPLVPSRERSPRSV